MATEVNAHGHREILGLDLASAEDGAGWLAFMRDLLTRVPKNPQPQVASQVRTNFDQADTDAVHAQYDRVVVALEPRYRGAAEHIEAARAELLASTSYRARSGARSVVPQGRLNKEIRRRTDVVTTEPTVTAKNSPHSFTKITETILYITPRMWASLAETDRQPTRSAPSGTTGNCRWAAVA